jgi:hypothetical protein
MTFCTTGVYGITNAWAGGLCEPPAFFVELGHSARRPQPRQVGKGGPWPAGAFQVYDGVPSKPFVPDAFGMTTAIVHAPSAGRGGKPAGLGEERVEARGSTARTVATVPARLRSRFQRRRRRPDLSSTTGLSSPPNRS